MYVEIRGHLVFQNNFVYILIKHSHKTYIKTNNDQLNPKKLD